MRFTLATLATLLTPILAISPLMQRELAEAAIQKRNNNCGPTVKPITVTGKIRCSDPVPRDLGYLAKEQNPFGEYFNLQKNASKALTVTFTYTPVTGKTTYTQISLKTTNGPSAYPYIAGVVTFSGVTDSIGDDVYSTGAFYANKKTTAKGATPAPGNTTLPGLQPKVETAIWNYKPSTKALTLTWVNANGSKAPGILVWYSESKFGFTGDWERLSANYDVRVLTCKIA
jgi:hypothetical protein